MAVKGDDDGESIISNFSGSTPQTDCRMRHVLVQAVGLHC